MAETSAKVRAHARRYAIAAVAIAVAGLVAVCLVPLLPVWPCVLLEHFRVQYAVGGLAIVACAAALRMRGYFDAAALATLVQIGWIAPDLGRSPGPLPPDGIAVRVLVLNVYTASSSFAEVWRLVDEERPDVIALVEVNQRWLDALAPSLTDYAGRLAEPREDNFGIALYTRAALAGSIDKLGGSLPTVVAETSAGGTPLGIVVVHTLPPISGEALDAQRVQLDAVAARTRSMSPVIVAAISTRRRGRGRSSGSSHGAAFAIAARDSASRRAFPPGPRCCGSRSITCSPRARSASPIAASHVTSAQIICRSSSISSSRADGRC